MLEFWCPYFWTTRISHRKWSRAIGPSPAKKRTQKAEVATVARGAGLAGKDLRFQWLSRGEHGNLVGGVTVNIDGCSMFFNHTWDDWLRWKSKWKSPVFSRRNVWATKRTPVSGDVQAVWRRSAQTDRMLPTQLDQARLGSRGQDPPTMVACFLVTTYSTYLGQWFSEVLLPFKGNVSQLYMEDWRQHLTVWW